MTRYDDDRNDIDRMAAGGFVPATGASSSKRASKARTAAMQSAPGVGGQYARNSAAYQNRSKKSSVGKKVLVVLLVVAVLAAVAGIGVYAYAQMKKSQINEGLHDMDTEVLEAIDAEVTGKTTITEPFTVLLLGSDARPDEDDEGSRTDTIILVRVDPVENRVAMVSIPRDTMVELEGVGTAKINAAYSYGGAASAISAVRDLTGVEIDHYAEVNFASMEGLIDAIGGIDMFLEEEIDDEDAGGYVPAGQQHLNGEQALVVARSRAYVDGDYTRQIHQRDVILAIINRVMNAPMSEMSGLISASTDFVSTDSGVTVDFLIELAQQMRFNGNNGKPLTMMSATLPSSPAYIGEVSYVVADMAGVAEMMNVFLQCGDVSQPIESSSIDTDIANAGGSTSTPTNTNTDNAYGYNYNYNYNYNNYDYGQTTTYGDTTGYDTTGGYGDTTSGTTVDYGATGTDATGTGM